MNKLFSKCANNDNKKVDAKIAKFQEASRILTEQYIARKFKNSNVKPLMETFNLNFSGTEVATYEENNRKFVEGLMKYCVEESKCGYSWEGLETMKNPMVTNHVQFKSTFNVVISQILTPVIPAVVSSFFEEVAEIQNIGWGDTGRFIVKSNDMFLVNDIAEGVQLGGLQRLYNDEITVNPQPKQIRFDMKWYQVASGIFDMGDWIYKMGASFAGYINMQIANSFNSVVSGLASPYTGAGFNDTQFVTIGNTVKRANGNADVYVFGTLVDLGKVFPSTVGLQYGLGEEMAKVGYLDKYKGFKLMVIDQALVPNTVNSTATLYPANGTLYFIPMDAYKPVKVVFEGSNLVVEQVANETSDRSMGMAITMRIGVASVLGSKFGAITGV